MKTAIVAASIASFFSLVARAENFSNSTFTDVDEPRISLQIYEDMYYGSAQFHHWRNQFLDENSVYQNIGVLDSFQDYDYAQWDWLLRPLGTEQGKVMSLDSFGNFKLFPRYSNTESFSVYFANSIPTMSFAQGGNIIFGNKGAINFLGGTASIDFGNSTTLNRSGSNLRIGSSNIVTEATGSNLYLAKTASKFQLGTAATAFTNDSFAFGDGATADGRGALSIGASNTALSVNNTAQGQGATAIGLGNRAVSDGSVAIGLRSTAAGGGVSLGQDHQNYGVLGTTIGALNYIPESIQGAVSIGVGNGVGGNYASAFGHWNSIAINADESFVAGRSNTLAATALWSSALGCGNAVNGVNSFAVGQVNVTGADARNSTAIGFGLQTNAVSEVVIGAYNDPAPVEAAFVVGTGFQHDGTPAHTPLPMWAYTSGNPNTVYQNALVVYKTGKTEATGNIQSKSGTGFNKFAAPVLVPEGGDISMGDFKAGETPN